jgi:hypothetical protein
MSFIQVERLDLTAAEVRSHLIQLESERSVARSTGVAEIEAYAADLEEELERWLGLYVMTAVTEIATLRAELFGAQVG